MEIEIAKLLDNILEYLDTKNIRKSWLDILTDLEIDVCNEKKLFIHLKSRNYIIEALITGTSRKIIYISGAGRDFINTSSFVQLTEKEIKENQLKKLQTENLTLQNTLLDLQTKQQKRYILFSIIGFFSGFISANYKEILEYLQNIFQV